MKLSVIIPVYQVEATLDRCVKSILQQEVDDMQVILVDDGSPDLCPQKCDLWAQKDTRILVIHKTNGGLSDARNAGIRQATSDLITFVDSDDFLAPDTYAPLLTVMGDHDILEYSIAERLQLEDHVYEDINEYWLKEHAYTHTYACNKIYRKHLFDSISFPKGRLFEDTYTFPQLLHKAHTIATTHLGSYHYFTNPQGITMNADGQALKQLLDGHLHNNMPVDDLYYMYLLNIQIDVWERTHELLMSTSRTVTVSKLPKKYKIKAIIHNLLGIKTLCRIFNIKHYIRKPSHS